MKSKVIYKFKCNISDDVSIGEIKRHFLVREYEHLGKLFIKRNISSGVSKKREVLRLLRISFQSEKQLTKVFRTCQKICIKTFLGKLFIKRNISSGVSKKREVLGNQYLLKRIQNIPKKILLALESIVTTIIIQLTHPVFR